MSHRKSCLIEDEKQDRMPIPRVVQIHFESLLADDVRPIYGLQIRAVVLIESFSLLLHVWQDMLFEKNHVTNIFSPNSR